MIEWQLYWKSWWKRPLWETYSDIRRDGEIEYVWRCWVLSIGPLQVRKIWYEVI